MAAPPHQRSSPSAGLGRAGDEGAGRPAVVYVMGAGRTGSTILGVTLGNCHGIFYAGELDKWIGRAGVPPLAGEEQARFWAAVRARVSEPLAGELERQRMRRLKRSSGLFRMRGRPGRRVRERYRRLSADVLRAVASVAQATHVVDSSHYPRRARQLQRAAGIDLFLVFLVRDAQDVVASWSRDDVPEPQFSTLKTNAYLWLTHLLSLVVFLRQPRERRLLLRHEDFVADPERVLGELLSRVGASSPIPDLCSLAVGVPFQGNRLVRSQEVALHRRSSAAARGRSRLTAAMQLPWALVFSLLRPRVRAARAHAAAQRSAELAPGGGR